MIARFRSGCPIAGRTRSASLALRSGDWLGFVEAERASRPPSASSHIPSRSRSPIVTARRSVRSRRPRRRGLVPDLPASAACASTGPATRAKRSTELGAARRAQTSFYDPATSLDAVFLVNVASYEQSWIIADPEAVELVIAATAELVRIAAGAGRQVGPVTNGIDRLTHERPRSPIGRGPRTVARSLEILARLGPYAMAAPETVFLRERAGCHGDARRVTPIVSGLRRGARRPPQVAAPACSRSP